MFEDHQPNAGWVIVVTIFVAFILSVMPLPPVVEYARPEWVAMVLVYWTIALPQRVGVIAAWCAGLMVDVLEGVVLGEHALSFSLIIYVAYMLHMRIRVFPMWHQCISVALLVGTHSLICLMVQTVVSANKVDMWYWLPVITSALLWPWVMLTLRSVRRKFHVR